MTNEIRNTTFMTAISAVMDAPVEKERDAIDRCVTTASERGWLGATAAVRARQLLAQDAPLEAAQVLVPAGWSVTAASFDLPTSGAPASVKAQYVARSAPDHLPTERMAVQFGAEDECHMPGHGFATAALAVCGEAMMLQFNVQKEGQATSS